MKYLGINLPKETKELYTENYKTLMKEIKDSVADAFSKHDHHDNLHPHGLLTR